MLRRASRVAFASVLFWPMVVGLVTGEPRWFEWDVPEQYWPDLVYLCDAFHEGTLPLWNPYDRAGYPYYADPQSGAYHPLNWAICGLAGSSAGPAWADARVVIGFVLAGLFGLGWLREMKHSWSSAIVGAALLMAAPFMRHNWELNLTGAFAWCAAMLWAIERIVQRREALDGLWLALAVGGCAWVGSPPALWQACTFSALYALVRVWSTPTRSLAAPALIAIVASVGLIGVVIAPGITLSEHSVQAGRSSRRSPKVRWTTCRRSGFRVPATICTSAGSPCRWVSSRWCASGRPCWGVVSRDRGRGDDPRRNGLPRRVRLRAWSVVVPASASLRSVAGPDQRDLGCAGPRSASRNRASAPTRVGGRATGPERRPNPGDLPRHPCNLGATPRRRRRSGPAPSSRDTHIWPGSGDAGPVGVTLAMPPERHLRTGPRPGLDTAPLIDATRREWRYVDEFGVSCRSGTRTRHRELRGYQDPLTLRRFSRFLGSMREHPQLAMQLNARWVLPGPHFIHGWNRHFLPPPAELARLPNTVRDTHQRLELRDALPFAYWVPWEATEQVGDEDTAMESLKGSGSGPLGAPRGGRGDHGCLRRPSSKAVRRGRCLRRRAGAGLASLSDRCAERRGGRGQRGLVPGLESLGGRP